MPYNDDQLVVTYASLDEAASSIESQARALDTDLETIQRKVASVASVWEGEAKTAYDDAQRKWDVEAKAIHLALMSIARAVRDAGGAYKGGDLKAAAHFM